MPDLSDDSLYRRGVATLTASWEAFARGAAGALVRRDAGVTIAVFPRAPERALFNNALFDRHLDASDRALAVDAVEAAYAEAGVERYAAWVHELDHGMRADLERRAYTVEETTRAMGMALADLRHARPSVELADPDWAVYLRILGVPDGLYAGVDRRAFQLLIAGLDGDSVACAMAFDHRGDRGIYNVTTLEHARRRGLGTAVTATLLHDGLARGCETASLQATPMAEGVYAALGFRDLGRILEYVPQSATGAGGRSSNTG